MGNLNTHSALLFVLGLYAPQVLSAGTEGGSELGQDSVVLSWYMPGAMSGDADAQYNLGYLYESGWGVDASRGQAIHWYRQAANNQHVLSQLRLGMMLYAGIGTNPDQEEGMRWLRTAAGNGNQIAQRVTHKVISDLGPTGEDIELIRKAYRLLEEGESRVVELLDTAVPTRMAAAPAAVLPKTDLAPHLSEPVALPHDTLGNSASPVTERPLRTTSPSMDAGLAKNFTKTSAIGGIGSPTESSTWGRRDLNESDFSFTPEAGRPPIAGTSAAVNVPPVNAESRPAGNDAEVEFNLGVTLLKGQGVTRDEAQGIKWLRAAASRNHDVARKFINLLDQAEGSAGRAPALDTLLKAARWWDVDSFYEIGRLYNEGKSVPQDNAVAQQWFRLASNLGNRDATVALNTASPGLSSGFAPFVPRTKPDTATASMFDTAMVDTTQSKRMPVFKAMAIIAVLSALAVWIIRMLGRALHGRKMAPPAQSARPHMAARTSSPLTVEVSDMEFMRDLWRAPGVVVDAADSEKSERGERSERKERKPEKAREDKADAAATTQERTAPPVPKVTETIVVSAASAPQEPRAQATPVVASATAPAAPSPVKAAPVQPAMAGAHAIVVNPVTAKVQPAAADNIPTVTARVAGPAPADIDTKPKPYKKPAPPSAGVRKPDDTRATYENTEARRRQPAAAQKAAPPMRFEYRSSAVVDATKPAIAPKTSYDPPTAVPAPAGSGGGPEENTTLGKVQYNIAMMFSRGDGVVRNDALAAKWFEKAARLGNPESQFRMWALCSTGRSGMPLDIKQAQYWLNRAAAAGHVPAIEVMERQQRLSGEDAADRALIS